MFVFKVSVTGKAGTSYALAFLLEKEKFSPEASVHLAEHLIVSPAVRDIGAE